MAQTITVRTAGAQDVDGVDRLLRRAYPALLKANYPPSTMVTAVPIISRAKPRLVCCGTYYVAEDHEGEVLGAGGWTPNPRAGNVADIRHVATHPSAVRRGVGRALLHRIFETAGAADIIRFECLSTRTAVPFYLALGFEIVGAVDIELAQAIRFPAVRMVRQA